ncbi:MAG: 6-carboxytetrahydropterin synthase QueD [Candidatus Anoxymicrobium japonicum]|uniref:6-carboxy-5,6,7,8-tetrahydropterin synthase n=1 Tax=Candidatus Anoxymicrobium japonicum TaxID=2013648 RepID=A0A2N3G7F2_9ACTN|nr:MAG: 6-carboxytetrahydropterin synthase QueD [Candidatus Anoxymicrobium japonicum]
MYKIGVKRRFSAAHKLEGHPGKCARLHGHTWSVQAVFSSLETDHEGMVMDFDRVEAMLDEVIGPCDHQYLNEIDPFASLPPTAENVARVFFVWITKLLADAGVPVDLDEITVWESPDSWASYDGGRREGHGVTV